MISCDVSVSNLPNIFPEFCEICLLSEKLQDEGWKTGKTRPVQVTSTEGFFNPDNAGPYLSTTCST